MVGDAESSCCIGPSGNGLVCGHDAECCGGVCMANGTGCATTCSRGMIPCGGHCIVGDSSSTCCIGPSGHGIACGANAECCGGVCVADGTGCAQECAPGLKLCGMSCLPGAPSSTCCVGPYGHGIICGQDAQCCDGICSASGSGCDTLAQPHGIRPVFETQTSCADGALLCGSQCLSGEVGSHCCPGPNGAAKLCGPLSECCDGACMIGGKGCPGHCGDGFVWCGKECLAGTFNSTCCLESDGKGMLCGPSRDCCSGLAALKQLSKSNFAV